MNSIAVKNSADLIQKIRTPGRFAETISRGKWKFALHLQLIDKVLMAAFQSGKEEIVVIEAPPRHGKSEYVSKHVSSWYLGRWPDRRVILTSYEADFARSWGRKSRAILQEHGGLFGVEVSTDRSAQNDWEIAGYGGGMQTAGVGGPITGKGAHLLIVDDYMKNAEEALSERIRESHWDWWGSTATSRLEPGGVCIVMATRWHEDDLSGRLIRDAKSGDGPPVWRVRLPALAEEGDPLGREIGEPLWPERLPIEMLERRKAGMDAFWWNALYQQRPGRHTRSEWPDEYFSGKIWAETWPDRFEMGSMFVDPSKGTKKGDFSAIHYSGLCGGLLYCDTSIERRPVPMLVQDTIRMYLTYTPDYVGIESNAFQELLAPEIDRQCQEMNIPPLPIKLINNSVNKELRIARLGPYLARNKIRFKGNSPGCSRLLQQLKEWPLADHDDGPDAMEGSIRVMAEAQREYAGQAGDTTEVVTL